MMDDVVTHEFGVTEVEHDELDMTGGMGGEDEALKHQQHLPVQLLSGLPVTLSCTMRNV